MDKTNKQRKTLGGNLKRASVRQVAMDVYSQDAHKEYCKGLEDLTTPELCMEWGSVKEFFSCMGRVV